jgi:hypothetical protein
MEKTRFATARIAFTFFSDGGRSLFGAARRGGEESPDTTRQHAAQNAREDGAKAPADGKCHRKQTAIRREPGGKGEKAG